MSHEVVRLGVVGLGGWGKFVVRNFSQRERSELVYICDSNPFTLKQHESLYPQAKATQEYSDLLNDPTLDAIVIATPAPFHYEMAKAALKSGKHVYVEKPMTLTSEHSEELVEISETLDLKLMVGHLLEYHPAVQLMKEQVDSGALGDIHYMYCQRINLGVVRQHENAFWSLAPHDISVILYLFGEEPSHITANGQSFLQPGIEDVVFANLHFPDGRMANIHVSWLDPHKKRSMVLVGSQKMLVFDDMAANEKVRIYDKGAQFKNNSEGAMQAINVRHGDILSPHIPGTEPLALETQHFIDSIIFDTTPRSDGRDGLRVVRILEKVEQILHSEIPAPVIKAA